jgi:hypothetical protein
MSLVGFNFRPLSPSEEVGAGMMLGEAAMNNTAGARRLDSLDCSSAFRTAHSFWWKHDISSKCKAVHLVTLKFTL